MVKTSWLRSIFTRLSVVMALVAGIGAFAVAIGVAPTAHAATECGTYYWRSTGNVDTFTYGRNGVSYTVKNDLQQKYDGNFGVWCFGQRNVVSVTANTSAHGSGTIYSWAANSCGGSLGSVGSASIAYHSGTTWTAISQPVNTDSGQEVFRLTTSDGIDSGQTRASCGGHIAGA